MGQSPKRVRPAPLVRLGEKFSGGEIPPWAKSRGSHWHTQNALRRLRVSQHKQL